MKKRYTRDPMYLLAELAMKLYRVFTTWAENRGLLGSRITITRGRTPSGVPRISGKRTATKRPEEDLVGDHTDFMRAATPADKTVHSGVIVNVAVYIACPLAGLFAYCVAVPDVAYDTFLQQPRDKIMMAMPSAFVGQDTKDEIMARRKVRATRFTPQQK